MRTGMRVRLAASACILTLLQGAGQIKRLAGFFRKRGESGAARLHNAAMQI
jgi:hypothetical protein